MGQILIAAGAIALALFFRYEASSYPATAAQLPNLIGAILIILGIAAMIQVGVARVRSRRRTAGVVDATAESAPQWRDIAIGGAFLALIVLYAWSITRIGYLIATPLFLAIPLAVLRPVGLIGALIAIVSVTAVIFGVFVWFLNLTIPLYPAF